MLDRTDLKKKKNKKKKKTQRTINFLNIRTPQKNVVITLKVKQDGVSLE